MTHGAWVLDGKHSHCKHSQSDTAANTVIGNSCVTRQSDTAANTVIGRRTEQIKRRTASVIGRRTEQIRCTTTACNASVRYSGKHCHDDGDDTTEHARIP